MAKTRCRDIAAGIWLSSVTVLGSPEAAAIPPVHLDRVRSGIELSAYQVARPGAPGQPETLNARFILSNFSGAPIDFELISHCGEDEWAFFTLSDEAGNTLWESIPPLLCPLLLVDATLENGAWILEEVAVPLILSGTPLAPGLYRVEAVLEGTPVFGAQASFEVLPAP